jgi:CheY-like chemotaxis protein
MTRTAEIPGSEASSDRGPLAVPEPRRFRVFHVNDSTDDQVIFQAACRRAQVPFDWHVTDSAVKGISYLSTLLQQAGTIPVCWPDLIVLDIVMPLTSGFEVLQFIRQTPELKRLPVVMFTGDGFEKTRQTSLQLGASLHLIKPTQFDEIVAIAKMLHAMLQGWTAEGATPGR